MFHVKQWGGLVYYCLIRVCDYLQYSNKLFKHYFFTKGAGAVQCRNCTAPAGVSDKEIGMSGNLYSCTLN